MRTLLAILLLVTAAPELLAQFRPPSGSGASSSSSSGPLTFSNGVALYPNNLTTSIVVRAESMALTNANARLNIGGNYNGGRLEISNAVGSTVAPLIRAGTNAANGLTVTTNGNVGIHTNTPNSSAALHVNGTLAISAQGAANTLKISSGGAEVMNLDAGAGTFVTVGSGSMNVLNNGGNNSYISLRAGNSTSLPRMVSATNGVSIAGAGLTTIGTGSLYASNVVIYATTNQVIFGVTNTSPVSTVAPTKWISVQVAGDAGVYRLPLYE